MRNIDIVELLLDKGAKVSAVDKVHLFYVYTHIKHFINWVVRALNADWLTYCAAWVFSIHMVLSSTVSETM